MIRDLKLERIHVSSINNAIAWSDDGEFAIPSQETITCIVSEKNNIYIYIPNVSPI